MKLLLETETVDDLLLNPANSAEVSNNVKLLSLQQITNWAANRQTSKHEPGVYRITEVCGS